MQVNRIRSDVNADALPSEIATGIVRGVRPQTKQLAVTATSAIIAEELGMKSTAAQFESIIDDEWWCSARVDQV